MTATRKPRVFISRTTTGLKVLADDIAEILRQRGAEPIIQSHFLPDWRSVPQMLQDKLIACDTTTSLPTLKFWIEGSGELQDSQQSVNSRRVSYTYSPHSKSRFIVGVPLQRSLNRRDTAGGR